MIRRLIFVLLFAACPAGAVCHVITPAGAGSLDGSTWSNAFAWPPPATLVRGDTYYVATGNYTGGYRFNTAESGTTLITVKKATATDHCTDTGFQASFGVGQAVFDISAGGTLSFIDQGYFTFDGQYRTNLKSGHGFRINWGTKGQGTGNTLYAVNIAGCGPPPCSRLVRNITVRYLEIAGGGVGSNTGDSYTISTIARTSNVATVTMTTNHRYVADSSSVVGSQIAVSGAGDASFNTTIARVTAATATTISYPNSGPDVGSTASGGTVTGGLGGLFEFDFRGASVDRMTLEYSYIHDSSDTPLQFDGTDSNTVIQFSDFARNNSNGTHHSEAYANQGSNNSRAFDPSGVTAIRYNVFEDQEGTAFIASVGGGPTNGVQLYGNVFMWHQGNPYRRSGLGNGIIATTSNSESNNWVVYNNSFINLTNGGMLNTANILRGTGFTAYNNLFYSPSGVGAGFAAAAGSPVTHDWTYCITTGSCPNDTNIQTGTADPFVDWVNENYHLTAATNAGNTLASPYNTDPDGVTRGADGTWDRGAFEFGGSSCSPVISSVTLNPTSVTGGTNSTGTATISCAPSVDTVVLLSSSNTGVATVPFSVKVLANQTTANFTVTTVAVCVSTNVTITATLGGSTTASLTVTAGGGQCQGAKVIGTAKVMGTAVVR